MKVHLYTIVAAVFFNLMPILGYGQFSQPHLIQGETFKGFALPIWEYVSLDCVGTHDLNGDGFSDVLFWKQIQGVNSSLVQRELIFIPSGSSGYSEPMTIAVFDELIRFMNFGDLDNNGFVDIVISTAANHYVLYNFGVAGFSLGDLELSETLGESVYLKLIDYNADGAIDIIAHEWNQGVKVFLSDGNSVYELMYETPPTTGNINRNVEVGDYDNDGDIDIIINEDWLKNDGSDNFTLENVPWNNTVGLTALGKNGLADFDGDGDLDVLTTDPQQGNLVVFMNDGSGGISTARTFFGAPQGLFYALDDDLDGELEVIIIANGTSLTRYEYDPSGFLADYFPSSTTAVSGTMVGHGGNFIGSGASYLAATQAGLAKIDILPNGGFITDTILYSVQTPTYASSYDIDLDGLPDVLMTLNGVFSYSRSLGYGDFDSPVPVPTNQGNILVDEHWIVDLDMDMDDDIIIRQDDALKWLKRTGNLSFTVHGISSGNFNFNDVAIVNDNNGNGPYLSVSSGSVSLDDYYNDGAGNFTHNGPYYSGIDEVVRRFAMDINEDGSDEIISLNSTQLAWSQSTFAASIITAALVDAIDAFELDVDNDGVTDIVVAERTNGRLLWLRRSAPGVFDSPIELVSGMQLPTYFELGDLDNDGFTDIVYGSGGYYTAMIGWMKNLGNGTFDSPITIDQNTTTKGLSLSDLDGDGDLDILSHFETLNSVWYYENFLNSPYSVNGQTYFDTNANGIFDVGDQGLPLVSVDLQPNEGYVFSADSGMYEFIVDSGVYQVVPTFNSDLWILSSDSATYLASVNSSQPNYSAADFGFIPNGIQPLANAEVTNGHPRCGEVIHHWISVLNTGNTILDGTVQYALDPAVSYVNFEPLPDSIIGNVLHYSLNGLGYGLLEVIDIQVEMPGANAINDLLTHELVVMNVNGDTLDSETRSHGVFCSYDPNDKQEENGQGENGYVLAGDELEYTVRFQNTGNDTAYNVVIRDALSDKLEWHTLQPIAWSHPALTSVSENGDATFTFENIFLVDSMTNPLGSQGFIKFKIRTRGDLQPGEQVYNTANIYFDQNPPITTNTKVNTIYECGQLSGFTITQNEACAGQLELNAWADAWDAANFNWSLGDSLIYSGNHMVLSLELTESEWLRLSANSELCPMAQDSIQLTIEQLYAPVIQTNQMGFCEGDTMVALDLSTQEYGRHWSINGVVTSNLDTFLVPLQAGTSVIVLEAIEDVCPAAFDTLTVQVNAKPTSLFTFLDDTVCNGQSVGLNSQGSFGAKEWYVNNEFVAQGNIASFDPEGEGTYIFQLVTTTEHCPSDSHYDTLTVLELPEVTLIFDPTNETISAEPADYDSYLWYFNSWPFGNQGHQISITDNGSYSVQVTDEFGCINVSDILSISVGVEDLESDEVSIYPNPSIGAVRVSCTVCSAIEGYQLVDLTGRIIDSNQFPQATDNVLIRTDLESGKYMLILYVDGSIVIEKIVIAR